MPRRCRACGRRRARARRTASCRAACRALGPRGAPGRGCRRCRRRRRPRGGANLEVADDVAVRGRAARRVVGREHRAAHAHDGAILDDELVDAVPEPQGHQAGRLARADLRREGRDDAGAGAPRDVEARHRVAVPDRHAVAALGPADDGEEPQALLAQPGALLAGRELEVRLGPAAAPVSSSRSKPALPEPVLPRELERVVHADPSLFGRVDEEQPAERPPRLPAEVRLGLLVEDGDALAGVDQFGRGDEAGEARADDDGIELGVRGGEGAATGDSFVWGGGLAVGR